MTIFGRVARWLRGLPVWAGNRFDPGDTGYSLMRSEIVRYYMFDGRLYCTERNGSYGVLGMTAFG
jgi:hypothetical protein